MTKKFYVGNLPYTATEEEVSNFFEKELNSGNENEKIEIEKVTLPKDRDTGRLRGFGFIEIKTDDKDIVVKKMNGLEFEGRALKVDEAQDRQKTGGGDRPRGGRGGFGGGRGGFNRNRD
jgi:RNA recognition motif-containing protein